MKINKPLVIRFGRWIMTNSPVPRDGENIINATNNDSPVIGARIKLALSNAQIDREQLLAEFNQDELSDLLSIPDKYDPNYDYTKTQRSAKRREILDGKAKALGFDSLSQMLTKWKNDDIEIEIKS